MMQMTFCWRSIKLDAYFLSNTSSNISNKVQVAKITSNIRQLPGKSWIKCQYVDKVSGLIYFMFPKLSPYKGLFEMKSCRQIGVHDKNCYRDDRIQVKRNLILKQKTILFKIRQFKVV